MTQVLNDDITRTTRRPPPRRAWRSLIVRRTAFGPDFFLQLFARGSALTIVLMLASLIVVLGQASVPAIRTFGARFLVTTQWRANEIEQPKRDAAGKIVFEDGEAVTETLPPVFGALPVIYGTAVSSAIALVFAVPLSLGTALFLIRIAPRKIAGPVSFLVEFLAAIPSIAYGIWGLFVLAPFLRTVVEPAIVRVLGPVPFFSWMFHEKISTGTGTATRELALTGRDMLCGGLILAIMTIPIITAISRDVLRAVPRAQIEGALALGATWWQSCREMLRYSRSGLFGAVMLGLARAAGETMAVTMVIGNSMRINPSPLAPAQTMSSLLANEFAEASNEVHRSALIEVALILLVMSLTFNMVARYLVVGSGSRSAKAH
jgi:phosphate transport system permease protein